MKICGEKGNMKNKLIKKKIWGWKYLKLVKDGIIIIKCFLGTIKLLN
jgi:hypothetical protein